MKSRFFVRPYYTMRAMGKSSAILRQIRQFSAARPAASCMKKWPSENGRPGIAGNKYERDRIGNHRRLFSRDYVVIHRLTAIYDCDFHVTALFFKHFADFLRGGFLHALAIEYRHVADVAVAAHFTYQAL